MFGVSQAKITKGHLSVENSLYSKFIPYLLVIRVASLLLSSIMVTQGQTGK